MPIDPSIYGQLQPVKMENPLALALKAAQLQGFVQERDLNALKMKKAEQEMEQSGQKNKLLAMLFPQGAAVDERPGNALLQGAAMGDVGPTNTNAARMDSMPGPSTPGLRMDLNVMARLAAMGVKTDDMLNVYKYANDGVKREPNTYYKDPQTGKTTYFADPKSGLNFDPATNTVSALPGFSATNASIKGAETAAQEEAKSRFNLLPLGYVGKDGRPVGGTVSEYLNGGTQPAASPTPASVPGTAPAGPAFVGHDLLMQIPPADRQKIVNNAQASGESKFTVNYKLPNGQVIRGQVDMSRDQSGNVPAIYQEKFDYIRSQATPEERHQFEQQAISGLSRIKDPTKRGTAIRDFYTQLAEPPGTPIRMVGADAPAGANGRAALQSEVEKKQQLGQVELSQGAQGETNKNWINQSFNPVVKAGRDAQDLVANLDALGTVNINTGWGTEAMSKAANVLTGLGIASKEAEKLATNAQKFQSVAMERLWSTLNQAKGPQTEGDADRAKQTFASLANTPQANQFILDLARAKANQAMRQAQYYQEAQPLAIKEGDLGKVDREWQKIQPSIWSDPVLQKYVKQRGK
jgi:hypothetical protein